MEGKDGLVTQNSQIPKKFSGDSTKRVLSLSVVRELCPVDSGAFSLYLEPRTDIGFALAALVTSRNVF